MTARDAAAGAPGSGDGAGGCLPGTVIDVTVSAQPAGEVIVGTAVRLTAAAEAVHWHKDCSRTVQEIRTGTWRCSSRLHAVT